MHKQGRVCLGGSRTGFCEVRGGIWRQDSLATLAVCVEVAGAGFHGEMSGVECMTLKQM